MSDRSPLAKQHKRKSPLEARKRPLYGVCVHTTGVGILEREPDPLTWVLAYYGRQSECGHYVIAPDGAIHQVAGEDEKSWHAGLAQPANAVEVYKSGKWVDLVCAAGVTLWQKKWPGLKSPLNIWGGGSPNDVYVGIELIPSEDRTFTDAQYNSLAALLCDIEDRRGLKLEGPRLVGHEDVHPLKRWDNVGGWDPGALREKPKFHWDKLLEIKKARACAA